MKKSLLFVAVMLLGMSNVFAQDITYITLTGNSTPNDRFYAYSGSSAPMDFDTMDKEAWTYEFWIKADAGALIGDASKPSGEEAKGASLLNRNNIFELYLITDDTDDFAVRYNSLDYVAGSSSGIVTGTMTSTGLSFDEWIHVAISRSADGLAKFYINGNLMDSSSDALWAQTFINSNEEVTVSDAWLNFNYQYRGLDDSEENVNFFKGSLDNIRVSYNDRYPSEFTPNQSELFVVDDNTLLQCDLNNNLIPFGDYSKIEVKGAYGYYIKVLNTATWTTENPLSLAKNNTTEFGIFPNPAANGFVTIQAQNNEKLSSVEVFNTLGKSVRSISVKNNSKVSLDVQGLTQGLYFVKATTDGGVATQKLVIK